MQYKHWSNIYVCKQISVFSVFLIFLIFLIFFFFQFFFIIFQATWRPNPSMERFSYLIQGPDNCSWRSFIPRFGPDKNGWDNWPSGKLLRRWQPWSDLCRLRSSLNRSLWRVKACWILWRFIYWIFQILSSRDQSFNCLSR